MTFRIIYPLIISEFPRQKIKFHHTLIKTYTCAFFAFSNDLTTARVLNECQTLFGKADHISILTYLSNMIDVTIANMFKPQKDLCIASRSNMLNLLKMHSFN